MKPTLTLLLIALFSTTNALAEVLSCEVTAAGDPNPDVLAAADDLRCAGKEGFENSCAYRELIRGEQSKKIPATAKAWAERTSRVFDPAATFEAGESSYKEIQAVASTPGFMDLYQDWVESGKPAQGARTKSERLAKHSDTELKAFYRGVGLMKVVDPTGTLVSSLDLVASVPPEGQKEFTASVRKALLEKVYREGMTYRAEHSVGCESFVVKSHERSLGATNFGAILKGGSRKEFPKEKEAALASSLAETKGFQSASGVMDDLKACAAPRASIRAAKAVIVKSCDVNLPMVVFRDNSAELGSANSATLTDAVTKDPCYQEAIKKGLKVSQVSIATSASTLNNTKNYCKYGFAELSKDRADTVRGVMAGYFGSTLPDNDENYTTSSSGSNGDGTSGECAYNARESKKPGADDFEVVGADGKSRFFTASRKPEYDGKTGEAKLEKNKFAKTTIYFENSNEAVVNGDQRWAAKAACRTIEFDCKQGN